MNEYTKMVIRDVNNYSSKYTDGKIKHKGDFEIDKELHKDPSMRIVSIALEKYFFEGIPISKTICEHSNIYDFCLRLRTNSDSKAYFKYASSSNLVSIPLSKTTRYYISNSGGYLEKVFSSSTVGVNVGFVTTIFNNYISKEISDYNIDYKFYILEARKIIDQIEDNQLTLF